MFLEVRERRILQEEIPSVQLKFIGTQVGFVAGLDVLVADDTLA